MSPDSRDPPSTPGPERAAAQKGREGWMTGMHGRRSLGNLDEQMRLSVCVRPMSDLGGLSRDLGECTCNCRADVGLPPLEFRSQCLFAFIDERPDRLRVRDRDDELHLFPAQRVHLRY
jgi:hypothetical protein